MQGLLFNGLMVLFGPLHFQINKYTNTNWIRCTNCMAEVSRKVQMIKLLFLKCNKFHNEITYLKLN